MPANLRRDHDELRAILSRYFALMDSPDAGVRAEMPKQRLTFSQTFQRHVREARELADKLRLCKDKCAQANKDMDALLRDYSDHIRSWPPKRIEAELAGYRNAVRGLGDRLHARLAWEERELLPLLESRALR